MTEPARAFLFCHYAINALLLLQFSTYFSAGGAVNLKRPMNRQRFLPPQAQDHVPMQRTFQKLAIAALFSLGTPLLVHANDISIYPAPFNAINPNDPSSALPGMEDIDIWARIRKGFGIPNLENPLVDNQTQWYSSRPDYIQRTTVRASRYLFHVVQELEKRGMPTELALLPFIESAFNPQALSTAKAAGMWQFIPSTGRDYNLKQNMFTDERRDVLASTDAALTYLQKLYGMFGDWQLALAAYNWGEGSVQRAVNRNLAAGLPIDFNTLSAQMPNETRNYVPKLQAVKNIIAMPAEYNIDLPKVDNQPYFVTISKTRNIDVKVAAQLAELSLDEFKALNPQFNRPVIIGGDDTKILLPESNAEKFKANMSNWGHALSSWTTHKISGARESIASLAARFRTTPEVIRQANNIPASSQLKAGSTILVPKLSTSVGGDIAEQVADNATVAFEAERRDRHGRPLTGAQKLKARAAEAVAAIKSRVSGKNSKTMVADKQGRRSRKQS